MIIKEAPPRKSSADRGRSEAQRGLRSLVRYLLSPQGKAERVGRVRVSGCQSTDVEGALLEIRNTQALNKRAGDKTCHLILSFHEQDLSPEVLSACEDRAVADLGFADHQRISVVHHDTEHLHVHVAISRIHPQRLTSHSPSFSRRVRQNTAIALEAAHGLLPDPCKADLQVEPSPGSAAALQTPLWRRCAESLRAAGSWSELIAAADASGADIRRQPEGLALVDRGGGAMLLIDDISHQLSQGVLGRRPRVQAAEAMERSGGMESLVGFVRRTCRQMLEESGSWSDLHAVAARYGLTARLRGNGLILQSSDGTAVKASSVSRGLSKAALEKRLGPFEPAAGVGAPQQRYSRRPPPGEGRAALYARYQQQRQENWQHREQRIEALRRSKVRTLSRLRLMAAMQRFAIKMMAPRRARRFWHALAREGQQKRRDAVLSRYRAQIAREKARHPLLSWTHWLAAQADLGDADAATALSRHKRSTTHEPARSAGPHGGTDGRGSDGTTARRADGRPTRGASRQNSGSGAQGGPRGATSAQPHGALTPPGPPARSAASLRRLSELDMVRFTKRPALPLQRHARSDLGQRGAGARVDLRRGAERGRVGR